MRQTHTQPFCDTCFRVEVPDHGERTIYRVIHSRETCCMCGKATDGIFLMIDRARRLPYARMEDT